MRATIAPPLLLALALLAAACDGGDDGPSGPELPASLEVVSGTPQQGTVGGPLDAPLVVRVLDDAGSPMAGVPVTFTVVGASGSVEPRVVTTGVDGLAQSTWTLGGALGAQNAQAYATGTSTVLTAAFTATSAFPADAVLEAVTGDGASLTAGTPGVQLTARLRTAGGVPIRGVPVRFTLPTGAVTNPVPTTDDDGRASAFWSPPGQVGSYELKAAAAGVADPATFTVSVTPAAPALVRVLGPDRYSTAAGVPIDNPLWVLVTDAYGNWTRGATVEWVRVGATGAVSPTSSVTNDLARASTLWQPSTVAGAQVFEARLPGVTQAVPARFQVEVRAGEIASFTFTPPALTVPLATPGGLVVEARAFDRYGNAAPTQPVDWWSSDPAVASVASSGTTPPHAFHATIRVNGTGTAVIRAESRGVAGQMTITVTP